MLLSAAPPEAERLLGVRTLRPGEGFRDPLGRSVGESIDPARYSDEQLAKMKLSLGSRAWAALWMQDPRVQGGGLIDRKIFTDNNRRILSGHDFDEATKGLPWVRGWDFAFTAQQWNKPDPDYTVGTLLAFKIDYDTQSFDIFIKDIIRWREQWNTTKIKIRETAINDGKEVVLGGEGNGPQAAAVQDIAGLPSLAEYRIARPIMPAEMSVAAQLWASRAQDGRMWLKKGSWNNAFFDEGEGYPNAAHDDIIKSISVAYIIAAIISNGTEPVITQSAVEFNSRWGR